MRGLLTASIVGLAIVACGPDSTTRIDPPVTTDTAAVTAGGSWQGTMPTVDGGRFDLTLLAGRSTLLWFWAPY